ncbi:MAG: hypothetical protein ABI051_03750 [Vicinamibacterales bacterium]
MVRTRAILASVALGLVVGLGCGRSPEAPGGPFEGTWSGAIQDSAAGSGTARLTLSQQGAGVSGTFSTTFADVGANRTGTVSATASGTTASVFLTPGSPTVCSPALTLSGTMGGTLVLVGNKLGGSYSVLLCAGGAAGSVDLVRQ